MNRRTKGLLIGTTIGAFIGLVLAWIAVETDRDEAEAIVESLGPSDYLQLGIGILTLGRQLGGMLKKI
jgi:hypothetical protein